VREGGACRKACRKGALKKSDFLYLFVPAALERPCPRVILAAVGPSASSQKHQLLSIAKWLQGRCQRRLQQSRNKWGRLPVESYYYATAHQVGPSLHCTVPPASLHCAHGRPRATATVLQKAHAKLAACELGNHGKRRVARRKQHGGVVQQSSVQDSRRG